MHALDLAKVPGALAALWKHRLILKLPKMAKGERTTYMRLAASSRALCKEFVDYKRLHPNSRMLKEPLGNGYRPLIGMSVTPSEKEEMALQDKLLLYMEELDKVLRHYQWPGNTCKSFQLTVAIDASDGLEKHGRDLHRMAKRGLLQDTGRRLSVLETATHDPLGLPE
jgi:hypothetical protein